MVIAGARAGRSEDISGSFFGSDLVDEQAGEACSRISTCGSNVCVVMILQRNYREDIVRVGKI